MDALEFVSRVIEAAGAYFDIADHMYPDDVEALKSQQVRIGMQPSWPLTAIPKNFVCADDIDSEDNLDPNILWIAVEQPSAYGAINPYAPKEIWETY